MARLDRAKIVKKSLYCWKINYIMGKILYIVGIVLAVLAVLDIFKKPISTVGKIICTVIVLLTSWVGLLVYFLWAKDHITEWFK